LCDQYLGSRSPSCHGVHGSLRRPAPHRRIRHPCWLQFQSRWFHSLSRIGFRIRGASRQYSHVLVTAAPHGSHAHAHQQGYRRRPSRHLACSPCLRCNLPSAHRTRLRHPWRRCPHRYGSHVPQRHRQLPGQRSDCSLGKRASNRPCTPRRLISAPPAVPCLRKLLQINRRHSDGAFLWIRASSRVHAPPHHCSALPRHRRSPRVVSSRPNGHSRQIKRSIHNISAHHVALEAQHLHPHIPREL